MPEKKSGIMYKLKNVFKPKKIVCEDIVCQADMVISEYISRRRGEIIARYSGKKSRFSGFLIFCVSAIILYLVYVSLSKKNTPYFTFLSEQSRSNPDVPRD